MNVEEAIDAYRNRFGENFPVMIIRDEDEIISTVQKCLETNKPFELDEDDSDDLY